MHIPVLIVESPSHAMQVITGKNFEAMLKVALEKKGLQDKRQPQKAYPDGSLMKFCIAFKYLQCLFANVENSQ